MRPGLIVVVAAASLACASSRPQDDPRRLIGEPLPKLQADTWQGWSYGGAHLIRGAAPAFAGVTWTKRPDGALLLTLIEGANTPARRETILDALVVKMVPGTFISMQCELDATPDPGIAAHVASTQHRWYTDVRQAWRLDLTKRKIVE